MAYAIFDTSAIHVQREDHWSPNRGQPGASDPLVRGVEGAGLCILITILCGSDGGWAEVDVAGDPLQSLGLGSLVPQETQCEADAFNLAEPALGDGAFVASLEVVLELGAAPLKGTWVAATLNGVCSGLPVSTVAVEEATLMGSLFEELEAREAAARVRGRSLSRRSRS
ncbi:hypothetical protein ACFWP7_25830 [Streptomyces sp. NPDC058470]|uniref:hypothetical protein n=1 Tax=Streptomyces sp. NPDC058470 TaxID=3346515 RepID=UPI003668EF1F